MELLKNSIWNHFREKSVLIIVPHQDDELFLCGTILGCLRKVTKKIYVAFTTNGDCGNNFYVRKKESIKALSVYGISKKNIIFMGYGDQYKSEYGHMYHAPKDAVLMSKAGFDTTYGNESCMIVNGIQHKYTLDNYMNDMLQIIDFLLPDVIFCNDLDWHPEHRFASLVFDRIMGILLKKRELYYPEIYKGFVYFLGWDGILDYDKSHLENTKKPHRVKLGDKRFEIGNPYFLWRDRIAFPVDIEENFFFKNKLYRSINKYHFSQNAKRFFYSMMNSDAVFWLRETNNILLKASIKVSSGNAKYLNDFVIADTSAITEKIMPFDRSVWYPSSCDKNPKINIELDKATEVSRLVFFRDTNSLTEKECLIDMKIRGIKAGKPCYVKITHTIRKYDIKSVINIDEKIKITNIDICMNANKVGLSEIEIIEKKQSIPDFIKIMINGIYAYRYIINADEDELSVYVKKSAAFLDDVAKEVSDVSPHKGAVLWRDDKIFLSKNFKSCNLRAYLKNNKQVYDIVRLIRK
ncbi:PIG-L family deacetylase [Lachnospiraceae bacterium C1.1]|nr:PIG-L family deacetylase [Lachnospiraceae bacterium C1.1]